ncbi:related to anaphase promoting complex subunit 10 [Ustilago trichophora]|uniref:Related to anaphase promoting complex subunit 10 n=1 Tax=Ustilago trichophora TaxID=86804 RepID=A0A5C3DT78_9BASI|nr:related to anaphase promoting complex subunit 10 [Ustilago trichophora]
MERDAVASTSRAPQLTPPPSERKRRRPRRIYDIEDRSTKSDVGSAPGTSWTLSSYKPGSGVPELRSADLTKLWQSDGNQPHLINIQFARRTCVTHLSIYLDVKQDDSYTPTKIAIKAGTNYHDLTLVRQRTFDAPQGWKHFSMTPGGSADTVASEEDEEAAQEEDGFEGGEDDEGVAEDEDEDGAGEGAGGGEGIRVWLLQVCILANHLNGKDTHIRRLIVFGPKSAANGTADNRLKRGPTSSMAYQMAAPKSRAALTSSANGGNVTLAQLLSLQEQAGAEDEGGDGEEGNAAASPSRRSGLNLFGNIR